MRFCSLMPNRSVSGHLRNRRTSRSLPRHANLLMSIWSSGGLRISEKVPSFSIDNDVEDRTEMLDLISQDMGTGWRKSCNYPSITHQLSQPRYLTRLSHPTSRHTSALNFSITSFPPNPFHSSVPGAAGT